jgi:hypothetical protein
MPRTWARSKVVSQKITIPNHDQNQAAACYPQGTRRISRSALSGVYGMPIAGSHPDPNSEAWVATARNDTGGSWERLRSAADDPRRLGQQHGEYRERHQRVTEEDHDLKKGIVLDLVLVKAVEVVIERRQDGLGPQWCEPASPDSPSTYERS